MGGGGGGGWGGGIIHKQELVQYIPNLPNTKKPFKNQYILDSQSFIVLVQDLSNYKIKCCLLSQNLIYINKRGETN